MNLRRVARTLSRLLQVLALRAAWAQYKHERVLAYIRFLRAMRKGSAGYLLALFFLHALVIGFFGSSVIIVLLATEDPRTRLWALFAIFGSALLVSLGVIAYLLSERVWFKASGAEKQVKSILESDQ
ncbi:MAG: hypothetical protein AB7E78_15230 [Porticoccaceae bacterium]